MPSAGTSLKRLLISESGATLVEYALLIGVLAIVVVAAGQIFGVTLTGMYRKIATTLSAA